jgi:hypothetical protein
MFNLVDYLGDEMPVLRAPAGPTHDLGGARFTSLLPVGGQGRLADGSTFVPPWAE